MDSSDAKRKLSRVARERSELNSAQSRRVVDIPVVVEPVVAPLPPAIVPIEVTHTQVAVRVAVAYSVPSAPLPIEYSPG
jgi:hypothetical protein